MAYLVRLQVYDNIEMTARNYPLDVIENSTCEQIVRMFRDLKVSASPILLDTIDDPSEVGRMDVEGVSIVLSTDRVTYSLGFCLVNTPPDEEP